MSNFKQENKLTQIELSVEEMSDANNTLSKKCKRKGLKKCIHHLSKKELPTHIKLFGLCPKLDSEGINNKIRWTTNIIFMQSVFHMMCSIL